MTSPNTMTDAIRNAILYQLSNIHTAFPARIVDYDYTIKQAVVQPLINKVYTDRTIVPATEGVTADGPIQAMPLLNNVPVIFPFASGASITFPVNKGDYCLVICCERAIDLFLTFGGQVTPNDPRKLDLSDAVAIMGLLPFTETSPADNNTDFLISYAGSKIRIKPTGAVVIETSSTIAIGTPITEVLDVLSQTLNLLATSVTTTPSSPFGFAGAWLALKTQLDLIKGSIP